MDIQNFEERVKTVLQNISSLDEFLNWLNKQKDIKSIHLENYLVKTNPPKKEIRVKLKERTLVINVYILPNEKISYAGIYKI